MGWKRKKDFEADYERLATEYLLVQTSETDRRIEKYLQYEDERIRDTQKRCWAVESVAILGFLGAYYQNFVLIAWAILIAGILSTLLFIIIVTRRLNYSLNPTQYVCRKVFKDYEIIAKYRNSGVKMNPNLLTNFLHYLILSIWVLLLLIMVF